jgi:hypothetical protein
MHSFINITVGIHGVPGLTSFFQNQTMLYRYSWTFGGNVMASVFNVDTLFLVPSGTTANLNVSFFAKNGNSIYFILILLLYQWFPYLK